MKQRSNRDRWREEGRTAPGEVPVVDEQHM